MREVVIVGAARTAIGSYGGSLKSVTARILGATAIKAALERAGLIKSFVKLPLIRLNDVQKNELYKIASSCIKYNDIFNISTKDGNVIMMSEDDYNNLIESLYLAGVKGVYEDIESVLRTPTSELSKDSPWK